MNPTHNHNSESPTDLEAERRQWEPAADSGDNEAMFMLGYLYAERMQPPDLDTARRWYERAADAGNSTAMYNLAVLYKHRIKPRDMKAARRWFDRAAEAGLDLDLLCAESVTRRAALRVYRAATALTRWSESSSCRCPRE
jgi:TPR repeat protein